MSGSPLHRLQERVHKLHDIEFDNEIERFSYSYDSSDVGKVFRQLDTNQWWLLTSLTPTFSPVGTDGYFLTLDDTPSSYTGDADRLVKVNSTEDGLDFSDTRSYSSSAIDPISPPPSAGDMYYNTSLEEEMRYDGTRSKWLTTNNSELQAGRSGNAGGGIFYRGINGQVLNATDRGFPVRRGTLVYLALSRSDADLATLEVLVNGVVIATLSHSSSGLTEDTSINVDFDSGLMSFRNQAGGNTTSNVQIIVQYKRRA